MVSRYSYEELFNLIKSQVEDERISNEAKGIFKKTPSKTDEILSMGLRAINNPTSQNLKRTMDIIIKPEEEIKKPDDRINYIYRAS